MNGENGEKGTKNYCTPRVSKGKQTLQNSPGKGKRFNSAPKGAL